MTMPWMGRLRAATESDFVRKVAETFATRVAGLALGLITSMIVARILGPDGRGLYAMAGTVAGTATQFGNLGLHAFNTYRVASDPDSIPALLGNSVAVVVGVGGVLGLLVALASQVLPAYVPMGGLLLTMTMLTIPLGLAALFLQNLLLGLKEVRVYNQLDLVGKGLSIGLIAGVIALQAVTVENLYLTGVVTSVVILGFTLRALLPHVKARPRVSAPLLREALPYGIKAYLAALFGFLVLRSDLFLVQSLLGTEQVGYYSVSAALADMVYMLPVVIGTILFPRLAAMADDQERWAMAKGTAGAVALLMSAFAATAALLAGPVVTLLYGKAFLPAAPAFVALLPGIVAMSVNTILMNYFASMAMPSVVVWSPLVAVLLNIGLNLWLIPQLGIVGASVSSSIAYGSMLLSSIVYIRLSRRSAA